MDRQFRVAVIGATGLVGETLITVLEERDFPISQLHALASDRSLGRSVSCRGRRYPVQELADFDFAHCDFALFCAGAQVSREYVPRAVAVGCLVIDNTSEFRYQEDVPLVVPEVNPHAVHIQTRRPLSADQARELLRKAPGVTVMDERRAGGYPTAATEAAKRDTVYVGRIREYLAPDRGLNLWIVADNVRKGAATNSVQIAEALAQRPI